MPTVICDNCGKKTDMDIVCDSCFKDLEREIDELKTEVKELREQIAVLE